MRLRELDSRRFGPAIDMGLRIVTVMEQPPPDQPVDRTELVSRRRLLQLAGTEGLVAAASACSTEPPAHPSSSPSPSPTATAASPASYPAPRAIDLNRTDVERPTGRDVVPRRLGRPSRPPRRHAPTPSPI